MSILPFWVVTVLLIHGTTRAQQLRLHQATVLPGLDTSKHLLEQSEFHTEYLSKQALQPDYTVADVWRQWQPTAHRPELELAAGDVFKALPKDLDSNYHNPCWTDPVSQSFRCLPYFQILGVSKCGTTDLYTRMLRHPDLPRGSKGPHFWDECPYPPRSKCTVPPNGDFEGYINLFDDAARAIKANPVAVTGEASSNTYTAVLTFIRGTASRLNLNVTLAHLLREAQPYSRYIIILRDPVQRYYSAFHYYRRHPKDPFESPDAFHAKAERDVASWRQCVARKGTRMCLKQYDPQQLIKGMYGEFMEEWTNVFPREQLLFLRYEDYKAAPKAHVQAVFMFLGLRQPDDIEWPRVLGIKVSNRQSDRYPAMRNDTRQMLQAFYRPYNEKLAKLMADDRFLWQET